MSGARLETPEAMAKRMRPCDRVDGDGAGAMALRQMINAVEERDRQIVARLADICARRSDCLGHVDHHGVTDDIVALLAELRGAS